MVSVSHVVMLLVFFYLDESGVIMFPVILKLAEALSIVLSSERPQV
jgi:hypothetical protein